MSIIASNNPFPHDPDDNWKEKLDRGGYQGSAQDLFNLINQIDGPDEILVKGKVTKTLNVLSIQAGAFTCRINQQVITNAEDYSTIIDTATDGYHRIDILVFTKFGTIVKIKGVEDIETAQEPDTPEETIKISFTSVFGSVIGDPEGPIESGFITKASKNIIKMSATGNVDSYSLDDRSFLVFEEGMLSLKSLDISDSNNFYSGKTYFVKNGTSADITLFHNQGTGHFKFKFPSNLDLVLKSEECVSFVLNITDLGTFSGSLNYIGDMGNAIDLSHKADLSGAVFTGAVQAPSFVGPLTGNALTAASLQTPRNINGVAFDGTANITINAVDSTSRIATSEKAQPNGVATLDSNGIILTTQLPSYVDDVLEYANLASFPTTGEPGKIYIAANTNKTYRWSGSVYIYITSGAVDSVAGKTGVVLLAKGDVGLGNVDNTSDLNKPISTAQQTALSGKQALLTNPVTGIGTANRIPKWGTTSDLTDSLLFQSTDIMYQTATYAANTIGDESRYIFNSSGTNGAGIGARKATINTADLVLYTQIGNNNSTQSAIFKASGKVGFGTNLPVGSLDVSTGALSVATWDPINQINGSISIANAGASVIPTISGKSSTSTALYLAGVSFDGSSKDFQFNVRTAANGDFTTLTNSAFTFTRFSTDLFTIIRNGNATLLGNLTTIAATTANHAVIKSQLDAVVGVGLLHVTGDESKSGVLTLSDNPIISAAQASSIAGFGPTKTLGSLSTATFPDFTELSYLKGVSSSIQNQLDIRISNTYAPTLTNTTNVSSAILANAMYMRIANVITVTIAINATVTTAGINTVITGTLPVNRITSSTDLTGIVNGSSSGFGNTYTGRVLMASNTNQFTINTIPISNGSNAFVAVFTYKIN